MHRCKMIQDKKVGHSFFCTACVPGFTAYCTVWPVSGGISSVNYILSNATFSEKKMGYQPIVLFQTQFSWANPGLEDMQQDLFLLSFSAVQCTLFRRSLFDFCRSQKPPVPQHISYWKILWWCPTSDIILNLLWKVPLRMSHVHHWYRAYSCCGLNQSCTCLHQCLYPSL